jgi:hypothetical protein
MTNQEGMNKHMDDMQETYREPLRTKEARREIML